MRAIILFLSFLIPLVSISQNEKLVEALEDVPKVSIKKDSYKMTKESRPAYTSTIRAEKGDVEKQWRKFIEDHYDCDFKKNKGVYEALGIHMPDVTNETVSLYTAIENASPGVDLVVMVDLGGKFIDGGNEADKLKRMISGFTKEFYDLYYADVIDDQNKILDKAEKSVSKIEKEGLKMAKSLGKEEDSIVKANNNITKSEKQIEDLTKKIEELHQSISDSEKKIKELESDIDKNAGDVEKSKKEADEQRARVEKLKEIRAEMKR